MPPEILIAEKGLVGVDYTRYSIAPCCLRLRVLGHGGERPGINIDDTGQEGAGFRGVSYGRSSIDLKARGLI